MGRDVEFGAFGKNGGRIEAETVDLIEASGCGVVLFGEFGVADFFSSLDGFICCACLANGGWLVGDGNVVIA